MSEPVTTRWKKEEDRHCIAVCYFQPGGCPHSHWYILTLHSNGQSMNRAKMLKMDLPSHKDLTSAERKEPHSSWGASAHSKFALKRLKNSLTKFLNSKKWIYQKHIKFVYTCVTHTRQRCPHIWTALGSDSNVHRHTVKTEFCTLPHSYQILVFSVTAIVTGQKIHRQLVLFSLISTSKSTSCSTYI